MPRLQWSNERVAWQSMEWQQIVFSDEFRFCLSTADGRIRVYRLVTESYLDECGLEKDRNGGGSVMVWGAMLSMTWATYFLFVEQ